MSAALRESRSHSDGPSPAKIEMPAMSSAVSTGVCRPASRGESYGRRDRTSPSIAFAEAL
jgi:hypothetical protein